MSYHAPPPHVYTYMHVRAHTHTHTHTHTHYHSHPTQRSLHLDTEHFLCILRAFQEASTVLVPSVSHPEAWDWSARSESSICNRRKVLLGRWLHGNIFKTCLIQLSLLFLPAWRRDEERSEESKETPRLKAAIICCRCTIQTYTGQRSNVT